MPAPTEIHYTFVPPPVNFNYLSGGPQVNKFDTLPNPHLYFPGIAWNRMIRVKIQHSQSWQDIIMSLIEYDIYYSSVVSLNKTLDVKNVRNEEWYQKIIDFIYRWASDFNDRCFIRRMAIDEMIISDQLNSAIF